jgi:hypothetical protein
MDPNAANAANLQIIQEEAIKSIAKRKAKLDNMLKKGYTTVFNQCLQEVQDKLKTSNDWDKTQRNQSLHELIMKIEKICIGVDNYKQEVFLMVQALKRLFLYTQTDRESMEKYSWNFKSLWDMVEAFGGSPGVHKGLVTSLLPGMATTWSTHQTNQVRCKPMWDKNS